MAKIKGFAWAIVDEKGQLIWEENMGAGQYLIYPTKKIANGEKQDDESVLKVFLSTEKKGES